MKKVTAVRPGRRSRWLIRFLTPCLAALPGAAAAQFSDVTSAKGLGAYRAFAGDGHGPGGTFADLDNDGYPDLVLVTGPGQKIFVFRSVPAGGGRTFVQSDLHPDHTYGSTGAVAGDYDNDGDLDIYVINHPHADPSSDFAPNKLYRNNFVPSGSLTFTDVTDSTDPTPSTGRCGGTDKQCGLSHGVWKGSTLDNSLTAAWADVDRDGDLDLYVGNHDGWLGNPEEAPIPGQRDILYLNNGNGTFTDVTMSKGVPGFETPSGATSTPNQNFSSTNAVVFTDLDNDGWIDLFVTNKVGGDTDADMTYINRGVNARGTWLGFDNVTYDLPSYLENPSFGRTSHGAMGVDAGDYDNDGDIDLYITDFAYPPEGEGIQPPFNDDVIGDNDLWTAELTSTGTLDFSAAGTHHVQAGFSWGAKWLDYDNDGWLDLYVATDSDWEDYFYAQTGPGVFVDQAGALGVDQMRNARGSLAADYDRDGAVDLFIVNVDHVPSVLYENQLAAGGSGRHYLSIQLEGAPTLPPAPFLSSRDALGARILVTASVDGGTPVTQLREVVSGAGNAGSTSELIQTFGLGYATTADVEVRWPSGRVLQLEDVAVNQLLTLKEETCVAGDTLNTLGSAADAIGDTDAFATCP